MIKVHNSGVTYTPVTPPSRGVPNLTDNKYVPFVRSSLGPSAGLSSFRVLGAERSTAPLTLSNPRKSSWILLSIAYLCPSAQWINLHCWAPVDFAGGDPNALHYAIVSKLHDSLSICGLNRALQDAKLFVLLLDCLAEQAVVMRHLLQLSDSLENCKKSHIF
ncbi:hypothetical protein TNCV_2303081 [Trichonephila clavipes]|nr:hypothetical protein TNCV_2303081 [Trichonephila clavipes]